MFTLRHFTSRSQQRMVSATISSTALLTSSSCALISSFAQPQKQQQQAATSVLVQAKRFNATSTELATANMNLAPEPTRTSSASTARATEIAKRINATKRAHQTATPDERKRLEHSAWADLNTLTEEDIASADGQAVAIFLNAWGYFAKFWARGKEGPIN